MEIENLKKLNGDLTVQLDEANKVLEGQEKAKLISEILPVSNMKVSELIAMDIETLKTTRDTLTRAVPKTAFNVKAASDKLSNREKGLTIGDRSVFTQRMRQAS